ncbi:MAG: hypothetical protein AAGA47_02015 [Pseudomonadota bacterium]
MSPRLKKQTRTGHALQQLSLPIARPTGPEDVVVCPRQRVDAIDLNKAKSLYRAGNICQPNVAVRPLKEPMAGEEELSRVTICQMGPG